jgi:hypothetical protein
VSEHRVRVILTSLMLISLFLPWHRDTGSILMWVIHNEGIPIRFILLYYPSLILLNIYLVFNEKSKLKIAYRILLFIYLPIQLFMTIASSLPSDVLIGYWSIPILTSGAAAFEAILMIWRWQGKRSSLDV